LIGATEPANSSEPVPSSVVPDIGTFAAEHLSPAYPDRAARGTAQKLRAWQAEALDLYFSTEPRDFLAAATPGSGKTTFALRLAVELIARRVVDRVTVVAPTDHLKRQWADAAHRVGLRLDPAFTNGAVSDGRRFHGVALTYAQVATRPSLHRRLTESSRTLVILDEVHHGGDALSWGDAIHEAFEPATRRLSLTGTPFRSDTAAIPFVRYEPDAVGIRTSVTDYAYGYRRALSDGVVRPVLFLSYAGSMRWRTRQGEEMQAQLGEGDTKDVTAQAWRTALDPSGEWMSAVLRSADRRLTEVRNSIPDAGGLVIGTDQQSARAYSDLLLSITGIAPTLVLSDEAGSSARIEAFTHSDARWMVAVRMLSEGVDVPRLAVGVYATSAATPLYFAQAVGRFVRSRRRGETASIFVPNVPSLLALAGELERERDHALDRDGTAPGVDDTEAAADADEQSSEESLHGLGDAYTWQALESDAHFDRVLFDGMGFGTSASTGSDEEFDFIGLPGVLDPDQVRDLLVQRAARQQRRQGVVNPSSARAVPLYRTLREQRSLLNSLVSLHARRSGEPHAMIHAELRRTCGGPPVAQATVSQLQARIDRVRRGLHS